MLGDKRISLVGANFNLFVSDESKPVFTRFLKKVYASNVKDSCEIILGYENEHFSSVYMEAIVLHEETQCFLTVVDISAFKAWDSQ
ncbi:MAG: hypothetical protein IPJ37_22265 [Bacteroidales bacterium]|nr:hypothetical protein [Bacteroidales bacterium]